MLQILFMLISPSQIFYCMLKTFPCVRKAPNYCVNGVVGGAASGAGPEAHLPDDVQPLPVGRLLLHLRHHLLPHRSPWIRCECRGKQ